MTRSNQRKYRKILIVNASSYFKTRLEIDYSYGRRLSMFNDYVQSLPDDDQTKIYFQRLKTSSSIKQLVNETFLEAAMKFVSEIEVDDTGEKIKKLESLRQIIIFGIIDSERGTYSALSDEVLKKLISEFNLQFPQAISIIKQWEQERESYLNFNTLLNIIKSD